MKRKNDWDMGECLHYFMKHAGLENKYQALHIFEWWKSSMGKNIVSKTSKIDYYNGAVIIYVTSAVLKNELEMSKTMILKMMNNDLTKIRIKEIEIMLSN